MTYVRISCVRLSSCMYLQHPRTNFGVWLGMEEFWSQRRYPAASLDTARQSFEILEWFYLLNSTPRLKRSISRLQTTIWIGSWSLPSNYAKHRPYNNQKDVFVWESGQSVY